VSFVLRDLGITIGRMPPGKTNTIIDVPGVAVGHTTLIERDNIRTGVTAIIPSTGNLFYEKVHAAAVTINGFGKAIGFPQINELGKIETPILLTNTLNVGKVSDALISWVIDKYSVSNREILSINPVIAECNDSYLNDIQTRVVEKEHVFHALNSACAGQVEEGVVGAGTGMSAFEFKSGIGSTSRIITLDGAEYTLGVLSLPNFGRREELMIDCVPVGQALRDFGKEESPPDEGSIVVVIGTDIPLSHRQLVRVAKRATFGIAHTGGTCHNGSGEFAIAFSTANRIPDDPKRVFLDERRLNDTGPAINEVFQATIEAVEESILSALFSAKTTIGRKGHRRVALPIAHVVSLFTERGSAPSV